MKTTKTNVLETKPVAYLLLASLLVAGGLASYTATAATEDSIDIWVSQDDTMNATLYVDNVETSKTLDAETEVRAIAELSEELGMTWNDVARMVTFEYARFKPTYFDPENTTYEANALVTGEGHTIVELRIDGEYYDYWIHTKNVKTALGVVSDIYRVPDSVFYDVLLENPYAKAVVVDMQDDDETIELDPQRETKNSSGLLFYVYQGDGRAAIMVYNNGALKESYTYESDNKSEIVSQLALRYSMTETELEERTVFESDGVDDVDAENTEGRDDNLDPHEGDMRATGNETPVAGY